MNAREIAIVAFGTASTIYLLKAARAARLETKQMRSRNEQIQRDLYLDMEAISLAEKAVRERVQAGKIKWLHEIEADFKREIAFQKIAVRNA